MNYHPKHKSNSRTAVWIGAGVLAAVAVGALIFIIVTLRSPMTKEEARAKAGNVYDSSAIEGGWDNLSPEEIEARLNEKVAEGMINISANTAPIFEDLDVLTNIDHLSQANYILEQMGYQPKQPEDAQPKKEQAPARPEPSLQKQRNGLTQGTTSTSEEKQPVRGRLAALRAAAERTKPEPQRELEHIR